MFIILTATHKSPWSIAHRAHIDRSRCDRRVSSLSDTAIDWDPRRHAV